MGIAEAVADRRATPSSFKYLLTLHEDSAARSQHHILWTHSMLGVRLGGGLRQFVLFRLTKISNFGGPGTPAHDHG